MHRVVTDIRDYRGKRILEAGPWLVTENEADQWAANLRDLGYKAHVERMKGDISHAKADTSLSDALASMA